MKKHSKPQLREQRKQLRQNLTSAEAFLWKYLKGKKIKGRKFRRQHSIKNFIVDFYCASEKLIIELDGEVHMNPTAEEKDQKRDFELANMGFNVIRFENQMIIQNLNSVLQSIEDNFK